ncbi:MAG: discoidin domain-containing protein [Spirochaetales bacterium]|nr:discoidin domain-containing protein [Spirochaetales bacterium]
MKTRIISLLGIALFTFLCCTTQSGGKDEFVPEVYSLERTDDQVWHIASDAEYYAYFNKIQETYSFLIRETKDPAELRRLFMERDLKIATKRLEYMADKKEVARVVRSTGGWQGANPTGHLFRMQDVQRVPMQSFTPRDPEKYEYKEVNPGFLGTKITDAITAIIQFDRQMKERGIRLIIVPVPNSTQVYAHQLSNDIHLEDVVWHPWAHMIVKLLENDVETLDLLDLFKAYSGDNTTLNYIDHHWGQIGLDIVGQEIAHRLEKMKFDKQYYMDPALFERKTITVDTPALIPYWDHIDVSFLAAHMPLSSTYRRDQILYKGSPINKAPSHKSSPVLIMGDSFIPHAADTSSGIYAHLAYYTRIQPAAYSRDAGAAAPPDFFKQYVAGEEPEPKVVIWEIYGSAFNEVNNLNNWHVISLPERKNTPDLAESRKAVTAQQPLTADGLVLEAVHKPELVSGEVTDISELPDIKNLDYPDGLYAYHVRLDGPLAPGHAKGDTIVVYSQFMKDFKLMKQNIVKAGTRLDFYLEEWIPATGHTDKIGTMQLVDGLNDLENDVYFAHYQLPAAETRLARLDGKQQKDDPQSLTWKLSGIKIIETIKAVLNHEGGQPARFSLETSLDGTNWFTLYNCQSNGTEKETKVIAFGSGQAAMYVRFTGTEVNKTVDAGSLEIYGY